MENEVFYVILYISLASECNHGDVRLIYREREDIMLALSDTFKIISTDKKVTQLEMANTLGISKQNFSNKVKRNTFSPDELVKIADMLDMELVFIDKSADVKNGNKYVISSDNH